MEHLESDSSEHVVLAGPLTIDLDRHEARLDGEEIVLTHRELELLVYLVRQRGRVVSSAEIVREVWGRPEDNSNTVAVHIKRLREKLGDDPHDGHMIRTVRGIGYRIAPSLCA